MRYSQKTKKTKLAALALALGLIQILALFLGAEELRAQQSAYDLFLKLPDSETNGLIPIQRREMFDTVSQSKGYSPVSREGFWLEIRNANVITLFGIHHMPTVYKLFRGSGGGADILAICRSLQTSGPASSDERSEGAPAYDLTLYQAGVGLDLVRVDHQDYIPPIGVLDFTTRDTLDDYYATKDLELINQHFTPCLTCHASVEDPVALDILTVTSINGASCATFITHFKLLPLAWNGSRFDKPYDRAVSPDEPWIKREQSKHGIYYHSPTPSP
ncbi:MAG: hypothetical protein LBE27_07390 [Deltaproteobacteria bacterium]|jgi:hypothetical protein|nr:hypothetical protein [Deltaproteobacteria bacterium]